ncbi:MAG: hypothetical protein NC517_01110 [Firmicutes bacterium]|nr:hypothetical protein [Bacillota bacterium]
MVTWYWAGEYVKVLAGYLFLMFIWPAVVLRRFLNGRSTTFCFAFCTTFQPVLINTVVIMLGLFHLLNIWVVRGLFYIPFLIEVFKWLGWGRKEGRNIKHLLNGTYGMKMFSHNLLSGIGKRIKGILQMLCRRCHSHWWEYGLLSVIIIYGMIYFSWGAFQDYSYGFGDLYPHNAWIYGLVQGQIFVEGVYPEGMHCFLYGLHALFGIRIYSCLLFMAGIHVAVYLLAAYVLFKEVFRWRYTPMLVLTAFLTLDVVCIDEIYGMSRLQWSLPMEFGLYSVFLCAAFLVRYLHSEKRTVFRGKLTKGYWDENLLVFALALAASLAIHFYPTIMAFFLCVAFVPVHLKRIFSRTRFTPLVAAVAAGVLVAVLPMGGALLSGIPFQGSIGWAMSVIDGTENQFISGTDEEDAGTEPGQTSEGVQGGGEAFTAVGEAVGNGEEVEQIKEPISVRIVALLQRIKEFLLKEGQALYKAGYETLYRSERAQWIVAFTVLALLIWLCYRLPAGLLWLALRRRKRKPKPAYFDQYLSITFASILFVGMYGATSLGLPSLIAGSRLCSTIQMLILAMMGVPFDILFTVIALIVWKGLLKAVAAMAVAGIYVFTLVTGTYHGFLYYELTRFNGAVLTTYSITATLPPYSYMIISPVDELYQQIQYGWHEELVSFVNQCQEEEYRLPAEHLFIFIEKTPIEYAQSHFFTGPRWLAYEKYADYYDSYVSQCPDITVSKLIPEEELTGSKYVFEVSSSVYSFLNARTVLESLAYKWCQEFAALYPGELKTYYEDEHFVCYYIKQNPQNLYQLGILYQSEEEWK